VPFIPENSQVSHQTREVWTAAELVQQFGAISLQRVVTPSILGGATLSDVLRLGEVEGRLCELFDGLLVEKTYHAYESHVALAIATQLKHFVDEHELGIVLPSSGMLQLFPNQVRIPDACFISWERLKGSGFPDKPVPTMVPDLVAEVISRGNTDQEMTRKLGEYFEAGVQLVWYVYPATKTVQVYTAPQSMAVLRESDSLDGGDVLPGLSIPVSKLFAIPGATK
jgi:Uma2 family endonuclease